MLLYIIRNNHEESGPKVYCDLIGNTVYISVTLPDNTSYTRTVNLEELQHRSDITDLAMYPICLEETLLINVYNFEEVKDKSREELFGNSPLIAGVLVPSKDDLSSFCIFVNESTRDSVAYNDIEFDEIVSNTTLEAFPKINTMSMGVSEGILKFRVSSTKPFNQKVYCTASLGEVLTPEISLNEGLGYGMIDISSCSRGDRVIASLSFYKTPKLSELIVKV